MVFSTNDAGQLDSHMKKNKIRSLPHNAHKNELKWIILLNKIYKKINIRVYLHDLGQAGVLRYDAKNSSD